MLQLGGEKMSKSLGNIVSIKEFLSKRDADVMRMLVLNGSYRAPLIFNDETLDAADKSLDRLKSGLRPALPNAKGLSGGSNGFAEEIKQSFVNAMDDDFNTPLALAACSSLQRSSTPCVDNGANDDELKPGQAMLRELTGVLGLQLKEKQGSGDADKFIDLLVEIRE